MKTTNESTTARFASREPLPDTGDILEDAINDGLYWKGEAFRFRAKAEDMLAALETLIDANKNPIGWDWDRARAAIAKAKGQL